MAVARHLKHCPPPLPPPVRTRARSAWTGLAPCSGTKWGQQRDERGTERTPVAPERIPAVLTRHCPSPQALTGHGRPAKRSVACSLVLAAHWPGPSGDDQSGMCAVRGVSRPFAPPPADPATCICRLWWCFRGVGSYGLGNVGWSCGLCRMPTRGVCSCVGVQIEASLLLRAVAPLPSYLTARTASAGIGAKSGVGAAVA